MKYIKIAPTVHLLIDSAERNKVNFEFIYSSGGSWYEKKGDRGRKHLLEHCIASRTKDMDFQEFKDFAFRENINFNAYTSATDLAITAVGHKSDFHKIFDVFLEIFTTPSFDEKDLKREKEIVLREISDRSGDPNYRLHYDVVNKIYSPGSFSQHEVLGLKEDVAKTSLEDLYRLHKQNLAQSHLFFCISGGGIDQKYVQEAIENYLSKETPEVNLVCDEKVTNPIIFDAKNEFLNNYNEAIYHELAHEHAELSTFIKSRTDFESKPVRDVFDGLFLRWMGGGLYDLLRDDLGLIYGYYYGYDRLSGNLEIELNCEMKDVNRIIEEINKFFGDINKNFKQSKFDEYKNLLKKKQEIAKDTVGNELKFVVKNLTNYGEVEDYSRYLKRVEKVTADDVRAFYENVKEGLLKQKNIVVSNKKEVEKIFD